MRLLLPPERRDRNDGKMYFFVIARIPPGLKAGDEAISIKFTKYKKFAKLKYIVRAK